MSIAGVVGANGHGKTLGAVALFVLPAWATGRVVVSNLRLYPEALGYPAEYWRPLSSGAELLRLGDHGGRVEPETGELWSTTEDRGVMLLLDEITSVFPSRGFADLPYEVQRFLQQMRKPDVAPVVWTAPAWARADLMLREVCQFAIEAEPMFPLLSRRPSTPWGWPGHRWFRYLIHDAFSYEEFIGVAVAGGERSRREPESVRRLWRRKVLKAARLAYDTREGVELLDHIACPRCGGKQARKTCRCP